MAEICALLGYYPSYSGSSLPLDCPETSVRKCHYTMDNIPEERKYSPTKLLVTQFSSYSSHSHPPNYSTHILKQTHNLSLCNFSGVHSGVVAKNSGCLRHEAVFPRLFCAPSALEQCLSDPASSSEQPCCN